ncbi:Serine/threonine-protein phosphatase 2B catalytic subunit gamma isoform [Echinococcus granulosus]|uniref:Serine/threonine-protein phosphatase 2B catalytic subunit gamma isoform n=1 Tax=Echinococcus granulosus TaxID=6210 RepID=W6UX27_ECHGR|nr:Serine/threonine-protein phosphatase 2B catalytic subunit gamma isoform [Echinococcus granulosus]EUB58064.1 Serine/threonine-protein phosphatase 2B catalytic subunit gamma isoform [Echinococcus granulosus]
MLRTKLTLLYTTSSRLTRLDPRECTPPPPTQLLTIDDIFPRLDEPPQLEILRSHLFGEGRLTEKAALKIIEETAAIFKSENNLIELEAPITVDVGNP